MCRWHKGWRFWYSLKEVLVEVHRYKHFPSETKRKGRQQEQKKLDTQVLQNLCIRVPKTRFRRTVTYIYQPYMLTLSTNSKLLDFTIKHTTECARACRLKILSQLPRSSVFLLFFLCSIHLYFHIPLSRKPLWGAWTYWVLQPKYNVRHVQWIYWINRSHPRHPASSAPQN